MKKFRLLIVDEVHDSLFALLKSEGIAYEYMPDISKEDISDELKNFGGLLIRSKAFVDEKMLKSADNLKVICRSGAGTDNIDPDALRKRNITLINAPEGNRDAVAEHTIGLLLNLLNKISIADKQVREGVWDREGNRGLELKDKCFAIIGFGNMGSAVAEKIRSFGCRIVAYDKYRKGFGNDYVEECTLEEVYNKADILSLHIPLNKESKYWIDDELLSNFEKPIFFLNTSRGEIVKLKTISIALDRGMILGAGLDVLENEKILNLTEEQRYYFNKLKLSDKIIFTPHVAGWSFESYKRINSVIVNKLNNFLRNNEL